MKIAISNNLTRRKARQNRADAVQGDKLSTKPRKLVQKAKGLHLQKIKHHDLVNHVDEADGTVITEREGKPMKIKIDLHQSTSADVIFNPNTDGTKYMMSRSIKTNLQRRMPGYDITVHSISGEGHAELSISTKFVVDDSDVLMLANAVVSPLDMAVIDAVVTANGRTFDVNPVDKARSPEETSKFLHRLALNCFKGSEK